MCTLFVQATLSPVAVLKEYVHIVSVSYSGTETGCSDRTCLLFVAFNQTNSGTVLTKRIRDSPSALFPFRSLVILQAHLIHRELLAALAENHK